MIFSRSKNKLQAKYVLCGIACVFILDYFGAFTHIFELEFDENFRYPYAGDISESVQRLRQKLKPEIEPINVYNYSLLSKCENKCKEAETIRIIYLVKSSLENIARRQAIRRTWGYEHRFSDVPIRTVFLVGMTHNADLLARIQGEQEKFHDIIQADFIDSYYNNTIKALTAFKWAVEYCSNAQFYFFSDDDMYVSTKNVLRFIRNPVNYPKYLQLQALSKKKIGSRTLQQVFDFELPADAVLYAGYVFVSAPHRHKSSKWYVSLKEYPYSLWPPYVTAGAYVVSKEALLQLFYTSFYTKYFKFDDIFFGLVALKAGIEPFHSEEFHFYKKQYSLSNYKYVVASHGYEDASELQKVWDEQRSAGHA